MISLTGSNTVKLLEAENRKVVARAEGREIWGDGGQGYRTSVVHDEHILEIECTAW